MPYFADRTPYSYTPSFYNTASPWTRPLSPFCCRPPCTASTPPSYGPTFHTHWNPPPPVNIPYYQTGDYIYKDYQPWPLPSAYHGYTPDCHPQHYRYFDRSTMRMDNNPNSYFRQREDDWNCPSKLIPEDHIRSNVESQSCFQEKNRRESEIRNLDISDSRNESGMNRKILDHEVANKEHLVNYPKLDNREEVVIENTNRGKPNGMYSVNSLEGQYHSNQQITGIDNYRINTEAIPSFCEYIPGVHQARDSNIRDLKNKDIDAPNGTDIPIKTQRVSRSNTATSPDSTGIILGETRINSGKANINETANNIKVFRSDAHDSSVLNQQLRRPIVTSTNDIHAGYSGSADKLNNLLESYLPENDASTDHLEKPFMNLNSRPNEFYSSNLYENDIRNFDKIEEQNTLPIVTDKMQNTYCEILSANRKEVDVGRQTANTNVPDLQLQRSVTKMTNFHCSTPASFNRSGNEIGYNNENSVIYHKPMTRDTGLYRKNSLPSPSLDKCIRETKCWENQNTIAGNLENNSFVSAFQNER